MSNDFKMPIVLIGNSFKYEVEATSKMFFPSGTRFEFLYAENGGENELLADKPKFIAAKTIELNDAETEISAQVKLGAEQEVMSSSKVLGCTAETDRNTLEHELCRLIYHILSRLSGITPPWGMMTGIRPVKKVIELMQQGISDDDIERQLTEKYEISPKKYRLAYDTAVNQLPILNKIDPSAVSLYVSIPFCPTRCSYCSFVSHSMDSAVKLMPDYVAALCRELEIIGKIIKENNTKIDTIYFGGGTPTSLSAGDIQLIMEAVAANFDLDNVREYSLEAGRADTITEEKLRVIKALGADRISVNPQTLNDEVLRVIGRRHTGADFIKAYETARKVGFDNINTDLIAGLPTESAESFRNTLDRMIELDPESITVHTLTIKRAADMYWGGGVEDAHPAVQMVDYSVKRLMESGYLPYYLYRQKNTLDNLENVGYAKKGFESYYNIFIMDETQTIIGAGCAASTKLVYPEGKISRIHNYKFPYEYIRNFDKLMEKKEEIVECLRKISSLRQK